VWQVFLLILGIMISVSHAAEPFPFFQPVEPPRPIQVMAHRGIWTAAPENTRRAITMAAADFIEWVEIDVRLTRDGQHVLFHDANLDAKSTGTGPLSDQTLAELMALDVGSWFAPRFKGERILTLAEAFNLARGQINLCIDAKQIDPEQLAREIIDAQMTHQVIVYGDLDIIRGVSKASDNRIAVMTKWRPSLGSPPSFLSKHPVHVVELDPSDITPDVCESFHSLGIKVEAKALGPTHDQPTFWIDCAKAGVDWIQSDEPIAVLMTLARHRLGNHWPVGFACHRGASRYAPENTLPAIELASRLQADYVEIDIRTTKEGQFVLLHDRRTDRTTSIKGDVNRFTLAEIQSVECGSRFGRFFSQTRVPTFEEAIPSLGPKIHFYLDAKEISPAALANIIKSHHLEARSVVYQSADYLQKLKAILPTVRVLPPLDNIDEIDPLAPLTPYAVDASWKSLSRELVDKCHQKNILVFSDALGLHETITSYRQAIEWGVDVIQTDHPARLLRAIELHTESSQP
jgi:glycerophosphoryl diester phosphodiesterase